MEVEEDTGTDGSSSRKRGDHCIALGSFPMAKSQIQCRQTKGKESRVDNCIENKNRIARR